MDTRGKTNAEFCNEINEIPALLDSSFHEVNATLQTGFTEVQYLWVSHSSNTTNTKINPFAPGESSHQPAELNIFCSSSFLDQNHHHLKLFFLKFWRRRSHKMDLQSEIIF
ncbi:hypothetical protein WN944_007156 [Citrus x changshan-huyou]|uniref:Uncharacterized protein n=1 Tax=Citrus x changshan-huyou TaxID=2935761 RepID=A0AAP0MN01_9ROSI